MRLSITSLVVILSLGVTNSAWAMTIPSVPRSTAIALLQQKSESRAKERLSSLKMEISRKKASLAWDAALRFARKRVASNTTFSEHHTVITRSSSSSSRASLPSYSSSSSAPQKIVVSSSSVRSKPSAPASLYVREIRTEMLQRVNDERTNKGLAPLAINNDLNTSAQLYAIDMSTRKFFSHTDPDGRGSKDRIEASGYFDLPCDCLSYYYTGENLAVNQKTVEEAVDAWMNSPGHKANILNKYYTEIGIGYENGYWVQHFGHIDLSN